MKELRELAQKLLVDGSVKVVVGYEEGPRGVRPIFVTEPAEAEKLIFDTRCVHNLAAYLNPRRPHIAKLGKAAVVVKGCDARAVAGLIREAQIKREDVVIVAVRCGGVVRDPAQSAELTIDNVSDRCAGCDVREPKLFDHLLGPLPPPPPKSTRREDKLAELAKMTCAHAGHSGASTWIAAFGAMPAGKCAPCASACGARRIRAGLSGSRLRLPRRAIVRGK